VEFALNNAAVRVSTTKTARAQGSDSRRGLRCSLGAMLGECSARKINRLGLHRKQGLNPSFDVFVDMAMKQPCTDVIRHHVVNKYWASTR
jgi:hypothetical protein